MGVGAVGGIMTASYNPYVYNTNGVSSASLNRISAIPNDATQGGVDFSSPSRVENVNPLKPGETKNFADVLLSQMSAGSMRQAQLLASNPIEE